MRWSRLLQSAWRSIRKNRLRSLLTMLGIVIGVASVIVMVAVGQGTQRNVESRIASLGTNLIMVMPSFSSRGGVSQGAGSFNRLTLDDVAGIAKNAASVEAVTPIVRVSGQVVGGGNNWATSVQGVSAEFLTIRKWELESGSFFTEQDITARRKVAVLGETVADQLFPDQDPVGQQIRIGTVPVTVVGLLRAKGESAMGSDQDDIVLVPSTTAYYRLSGSRFVGMIMASAKSLEVIETAQEEITTSLRNTHHLESDEDNDFNVRTQAEITEAASETSRILTILLGAIAAVSLIVGGIGIMNIMLVSVTERTHEIGIRVAVGARSVDILTQFLVEAVVLCAAGGIVGTGVAYVVAAGLQYLADITTPVNPLVVLLVLVFSGAIGVFFGFYPARRASRLNPIEALRYE